MKRKLSVLLVIGLLICIKCQDLMYKKYYIRMYNLVLLFKWSFNLYDFPDIGITCA